MLLNNYSPLEYFFHRILFFSHYFNDCFILHCTLLLLKILSYSTHLCQLLSQAKGKKVGTYFSITWGYIRLLWPDWTSLSHVDVWSPPRRLFRKVRMLQNVCGFTWTRVRVDLPLTVCRFHKKINSKRQRQVECAAECVIIKLSCLLIHHIKLGRTRWAGGGWRGHEASIVCLENSCSAVEQRHHSHFVFLLPYGWRWGGEEDHSATCRVSVFPFIFQVRGQGCHICLCYGAEHTGGWTSTRLSG